MHLQVFICLFVLFAVANAGIDIGSLLQSKFGGGGQQESVVKVRQISSLVYDCIII